jgi:hypothetical protein
LVNPAAVAGWPLDRWDEVVPQARVADLLARVGAGIHDVGLQDRVPDGPARHLQGALALARRQQTELGYEVQAIADALASVGMDVVLLKGAAYAMLSLPVARGRLVSDVDILVPRERLADAESALMRAGWVHTNRDEYDQRYYRQWMHELPPMRHVHRGSVLDVHHAIAPPTSRWHPDTGTLLANARAVAGDPCVRALADVDLVLHSSVHLCLEGELDRGLRGLMDIVLLIQQASAEDEGFATRLLARANHLGLDGPLRWALRYAALLLRFDAPAPLRRAWPDTDPARGGWLQRCSDAVFLRGLSPPHASCSDAWTPAARLLLYLRGHWLRMPLAMLLPHLARKAWRAIRTTQRNEP